jgi:hypothetical protein
LTSTNASVNKTHFEAVKDIKELMCHVSHDYREESKSRDDPLNQEQRSYELPGG